MNIAQRLESGESGTLFHRRGIDHEGTVRKPLSHRFKYEARVVSQACEVMYGTLAVVSDNHSVVSLIMCRRVYSIRLAAQKSGSLYPA